ncbi:MAG: hypothetical protein L6271_10130 [Desulfobacteraceae bacterium]|nr:hypothetical protein [Desulfobacteraceae bacterium]
MMIKSRIRQQLLHGHLRPGDLVGDLNRTVGWIGRLDLQAHPLHLPPGERQGRTPAAVAVRRIPCVPEGMIERKDLAVHGRMRRPGPPVIDRVVLEIGEGLGILLLRLIAAAVVGGLYVGAKDVLHPPLPLAGPATALEDPGALFLEFAVADPFVDRRLQGVEDRGQLVTLGDAGDAEGADLRFVGNFGELCRAELDLVAPELGGCLHGQRIEGDGHLLSSWAVCLPNRSAAKRVLASTSSSPTTSSPG